jgi:hypothetical protein
MENAISWQRRQLRKLLFRPFPDAIIRANPHANPRSSQLPPGTNRQSGGINMKSNLAIALSVLGLLTLGLIGNLGCTSSVGGQTNIKLSPSNATIIIGPNGTSFTGVKPDQVQIQWPTTN